MDFRLFTRQSMSFRAIALKSLGPRYVASDLQERLRPSRNVTAAAFFPTANAPQLPNARLHHECRRRGPRCLMIKLRETDVDALIRGGLLEQETRNDRSADPIFRGRGAPTPRALMHPFARKGAPRHGSSPNSDFRFSPDKNEAGRAHSRRRGGRVAACGARTTTRDTSNRLSARHH